MTYCGQQGHGRASMIHCCAHGPATLTRALRCSRCPGKTLPTNSCYGVSDKAQIHLLNAELGLQGTEGTSWRPKNGGGAAGVGNPILTALRDKRLGLRPPLLRELEPRPLHQTRTLVNECAKSNFVYQQYEQTKCVFCFMLGLGGGKNVPFKPLPLQVCCCLHVKFPIHTTGVMWDIIK